MLCYSHTQLNWEGTKQSARVINTLVIVISFIITLVTWSHDLHEMCHKVHQPFSYASSLTWVIVSLHCFTVELKESINGLIDDALLGADENKSKTSPRSRFHLPDLSFLRTNKEALTENKWWKEIFDQPSFCNFSTTSRTTASGQTCSQCEKKHSSDHHFILFQVSHHSNTAQLINQIIPVQYQWI